MVQSSFTTSVDGGIVGNRHHGLHLTTNIETCFYIAIATSIIGLFVFVILMISVFKLRNLIRMAKDIPIYFQKPIVAKDVGKISKNDRKRKQDGNEIVYKPTTAND